MQDLNSFITTNESLLKPSMASSLRSHVMEYLLYSILYIFYVVLNFTSVKFYGGSSLRVLYGLNRKIEDFDFQTQVELDFDSLSLLLKKSIMQLISSDANVVHVVQHEVFHSYIISIPTTFSDEFIFKVDINFYTNNVDLPSSRHSVRFQDINIPVEVYRPDILMSGKICAIYYRTLDQVRETYPDRPRDEQEQIFASKRVKDLFDLLWFMKNKIVPYNAYLLARGIDLQGLNLFDFLHSKLQLLDVIHYEKTAYLFDEGKEIYIPPHTWKETIKNYYKAVV